MKSNHYDVIILGAGLAGLSLTRQLLMNTKKKILLLEKRPEVPPLRQKVGEATVQLSGYYFSKVLDLEEYLLQEHYLKYNLRFYWATPGRDNSCYWDYSQSYIREVSNIASFQLDRNKIEKELLRLNLEYEQFEFQAGIANLHAEVGKSGNPHVVSFEVGGQRTDLQADWLVDTSGRAKFLAREMGLAKSSPIRHGATFFWVEGLLNAEKFTGGSYMEGLAHPNRQKLGHFPAWLATNHFMGEGYWFWTIPLHGKTSVGLVYDHNKVSADEVSSPEKVIAWLSDKFPLLANALDGSKILDQGLYRDFSYDCTQTISVDRWAIAGEAGRFTDPLYSPGGDLISLYNTLITDAILTENQNSLVVKVRLYELLMWAFYEAYVPSYSVSYEVLGDQECFAMKYSWELMIYFTFYVFPFINQMFTDTTFVVPFLDMFAQLGAINTSLQAFIAAFYQWKKSQGPRHLQPILFDFASFEPLKKSAELFFQVGLTSQECAKTLKRQMANVEKMARFIVSYIYSVVLDDENVLTIKELAETVNIEKLNFDPEEMRQTVKALDLARDPKLGKIGFDFIVQFRKPADEHKEKESKTSS